MASGYPTGLSKLDDTIGGGLPPGSLTVATVPPTSSGELLGHSTALENDLVHILSTYRNPERLRAELNAATDSTSLNVAGPTSNDSSEHLRISSLDPTTVTPEEEETTPEWLSPVDEHQAAIEDSAELNADSLSVLVVDSLSAVSAAAGRNATVDVVGALQSFADSHDTAVLAFVDDTTPRDAGTIYALRAADLLFTYVTADSAENTDHLTVRRVRRTSQDGTVSDLPETLSLSLSTMLDQSPDNAI